MAAQVAEAAGLDMRQCWTATAESYLGRVSKVLILEAVREGAGAKAATGIAGTKKEVMVQEAATLLAGTGWLPGMLRGAASARPMDCGQGASMPPAALAAE